MAEGWIKLNRSIQDHWLWTNTPYDEARAFIDLIMLANYEDKKIPYKGEIITCKRGDVNLSLLYLAERWKWSTWKVRKFIGLLEKDGMVTTNRTTHRTTITIVNYGVYQDIPTTKRTTKQTTDQTTSHQQATITKKDKKDNNILPNGNIGHFVPPSFEEVKAYCDERKNGIDAQRFIDFYSTKGWMVGKNKMKDWKAAVRTWEGRSTNGGNNNTQVSTYCDYTDEYRFYK